jgi:processive 1,2-diacylglycerol beta-glucosyltransferase
VSIHTASPAAPSVLVLTAGYGEGHNAAARAVLAACEEARGPGAARLVDLFALTSPRVNRLSRRAYLGMINGMPRVWRQAYAWMDRSVLLPGIFARMGRDLRRLSAILAEDRPGAVCSTYPVYAFLLEKLRSQSRLEVPHFNVVTDSISVNSLWWRAGCNGWFLPNEETAAVFRRSGVDESRLHVTGFPVDPRFGLGAGPLEPPDLAAGSRPRVLFVINSGSRHAAPTARRLLAEEGWDVTFAVGRNERLRRELEAAAAGRRHPARILGWTDEMPRLLMTHHVVISKAGGATTQEAIAARCPMIVSQVVPGQEEGNWELLRRRGIGAIALRPEAVEAALRGAFSNRGAVWRAWRGSVESLARPGAARDIAAHLLGAAAESRRIPLCVPAGAPPG